MKVIGLTKAAFVKLKSVLSNLSIGIGYLIRCDVWSALAYGCEACTVRKDLGNTLEAAGMFLFLRKKDENTLVGEGYSYGGSQES